MECAVESTRQLALLEKYQTLLSRTQRMLALARDADWAALIDQESNYVVQVEQLIRLDAELQLDTDGRDRKARLLEQILENDLEIRQHLMERREELGNLIGATQRQRSLRRTYGVVEQATATPADMRFTKRSP